MLFASIDIGSNAVRLLFANVYESNSAIRIDKATLIRVPVRLGLDVFNNGFISNSRINNLISCLKAFKLLINIYEPIGYKAVATAAMREASNGQQIISKIINEVGINIETIDGIEEANIISSLCNTGENSSFDKKLFVDVGGGSTELSIFDKDKFVASNSFNIGTIRLLSNKVDLTEWDKLKIWLNNFVGNGKNTNCIGSGGNINKLTKIFGNIKNSSISLKQLLNAYSQLDKLSVDQRINKYSLRPDRADVILPATQVFLNILKWTNINKINVPKIGLADGLILMQYKYEMNKTSITNKILN